MQKDNFHVRQVRVEVESSHEADKPLAKSHVDHAGKTFTNTDENWLEARTPTVVLCQCWL